MPRHALWEGSPRCVSALKESASGWGRKMDIVDVPREQRGLGDQPFLWHGCPAEPAAAGWGVLSASPVSSPGSPSRERGESGIHCVVVSNFLLLSRSSLEAEHCPKRLRRPRPGARQALGEVAPGGCHDQALEGRWRLIPSSETLWGQWGLVASSIPALWFTFLPLGF